MKILFVLPRMVTGGVERVTLRLIEELQQRGHECAFALRQAYGEFLQEAQELCPVFEIAASGLHQFVPNLAKLIRKRSGKKVFWSHGVHGPHDLITAKLTLMGRFRFYLDNLFASIVYQKCDVVVAVSNGVQQDILNKFKCPQNKVITIYNPVLDETQFIPKSQATNLNHTIPKIIALGRLTRQKGFDILIQAMQKVPQPWRLEIWGDGEEKQTLQNMINKYELKEHIFLMGNTSKPFEVLRQADLFVLSSRFEGLPTVLIEALCCQCNIVATNCPHGISEILEDGRWGTLVKNENPDSLAQGIIQNLREKKSIASQELLYRAETFTIEKAVDAWEKVLRSFECNRK